MGWFAKIEKKEEEMLVSYDPNNPYSMSLEDEGEFITIYHTRNIDKLEEEEDGSTADRSDTSKR